MLSHPVRLHFAGNRNAVRIIASAGFCGQTAPLYQRFRCIIKTVNDNRCACGEFAANVNSAGKSKISQIRLGDNADVILTA